MQASLAARTDRRYGRCLTPLCDIAHNYPRVCGGTGNMQSGTCRDTGLSPRVRGNPGRFQTSRGFLGSIPACAGEPQRSRAAATGARVYPRVCGGTRPTPSRQPPASGLSPRVRGNRIASAISRLSMGSIPACAGEPQPRYHCCLPQGVYPRVCGGTRGTSAQGGARLGLSPRVRGNRGPSIFPSMKFGSIPACAGEPVSHHLRRRSLRVYPRVCGGTARASASALVNWGLSPRVRGNPSMRCCWPTSHGSIPACAGEPPTATQQ